MRMNVAYLRVSTEAQTEKFGLDVQRQKITEYCNKNNIIIDKWYIDGGYSGSKLDRPQINELLADAESGCINQVFIYKLDRMSRDVIDTLTLLYRLLPMYGVRVVSMTEELNFNTPMDKVMIGVNAIMGQYEREVIYMRTRAGMIERVKKGLWMGGGRIPYGYYYDRNDGILHPKAEEAEKVKQIFELYISGMSCDKISALLGFKGDKIVHNILTRKSNIGIIEYKGKEYKGLHEPIISNELYYAAQECMRKRSTNSHVSNYHILTGLCYCGVCGARMRYHKWDGNHRIVCYSQFAGKEYMQRDRNCNNCRPQAKKIEIEVENYFKQFAIKLNDNVEQMVDKRSVIESSIKKSKNKIKKLYGLYAENDSLNLLEVIQSEETHLKELESELKIELANGVERREQNIAHITKIADIWDTLSSKEKNKILKECVEKVVITGENIEILFTAL